MVDGAEPVSRYAHYALWLFALPGVRVFAPWHAEDPVWFVLIITGHGSLHGHAAVDSAWSKDDRATQVAQEVCCCPAACSDRANQRWLMRTQSSRPSHPGSQRPRGRTGQLGLSVGWNV